MPVIITLPSADDQPFGPGFQILGNAGQGPLPTEQYWLVELFGTPDGEGSVINSVLTSRNLTVSEIAWGEDTNAFPVYGISDIAHGTPGLLRLSLRTTGNVIVDQAQRLVTIDWQSGMPWILNKTVGDGTANPDIEIIKQAVTIDVGGALRGISDLLGGGLPPNFYTRQRIDPDRTGSGELVKIDGALTVAANGIAWEVVDRKSGLGIDEGAPDHLEINALQLRYVLTLADGFTYTAEHVATPELTGAWVWGFVTPSRLDYYIVPGVTVRFYWLVPTFPPFWLDDAARPTRSSNPLQNILIGR